MYKGVNHTPLFLVITLNFWEKMETKEEVKKSNFKLPERKIVVKFIPRKKGMAASVSDDHVIAGGMMSKSVRKYQAPLQANGSIANVLTKDEKNYLEGVTGLNLSVYGDFWTDFFVPLYKEDSQNTFYLDDPMDYISYKILSSINNKIAKSWKEKDDDIQFEFSITEEGELQENKKSKLDTKKDAFKHYVRIEDDKDTLISILKLSSNQRISADSKLSWLQGKVEEFLDGSPSKYLSIVNDPTFEIKALINKAVDKGIILRKGNKYSSIDGLEFSVPGELPSFENAVKYLNDPKNQEIKDLIEARLNNTK